MTEAVILDLNGYQVSILARALEMYGVTSHKSPAVDSLLARVLKAEKGAECAPCICGDYHSAEDCGLAAEVARPPGPTPHRSRPARAE